MLHWTHKRKKKLRCAGCILPIISITSLTSIKIMCMLIVEYDSLCYWKKLTAPKTSLQNMLATLFRWQIPMQNVQKEALKFPKQTIWDSNDNKAFFVRFMAQTLMKSQLVVATKSSQKSNTCHMRGWNSY